MLLTHSVASIFSKIEPYVNQIPLPELKSGLCGAGVAPEVGEVTALLRLDRLDGALFTVEKGARPRWLVHQREAAPILGETGVALDEVRFIQFQEEAMARISASAIRTWPGQRQQAVQRWHSRKTGIRPPQLIRMPRRM